MALPILMAVGVAGTAGAPGALLADSALKGAALLALAAFAAAILRRDSAATRHLVWLLAAAALLAVPVLSALLPQWRVLPGWVGPAWGRASGGEAAGLRHVAAVETSRPPAARYVDSDVDGAAGRAAHAAPKAGPVETGWAAATAHSPAAAPADSRGGSRADPRMDGPHGWEIAGAGSVATPATREAVAAPVVRGWKWVDVLPVVWAIGFGVLTLRLAAARWALWRIERAADSADDAIGAAMDAARARLGVRRPVTLLIHPGETVPLVWGIFRCRLLLPAAARQWDGGQLRSVLLHELAHVRRGDAAAQLLAQVACALHWFNPLAWFAAWRLGVERERACDDLVLASGVRPSAYAGHLLDVVTGLATASVLSPARWGQAWARSWTQACGLAMARRSSLEGRLAAVLSGTLNRRGVSGAAAAAALAVAAAVAVPVAMLRAADERPGAPVRQEPQKPTEGVKLRGDVEERLQWGEPANGLRAALIKPAALGEPGEPRDREVFDFRLVVQNVSDVPVHFSTSDAGPQNPRLVFRKDGRPLGIFTGDRPPAADFMLRPREAAVMRLFSQRTEGQSITRDDPGLTFSADLSVGNAPAGAWTGKLTTADTAATFTADGLLPKNKDARALFKYWNEMARGNAKIPGGMVGLLAESVTTFTKHNPTWQTTPQLLKMLPRLDATRDWTGPEALALLDDLAAVQDTPIAIAVEREADRTVRTGLPLPQAFADAPWGAALPNGLRAAWLLEPRAAAYPLNTPLKSRILIHNAGNTDVVFRTRTWHQGGFKAADANGAELKVESIEWTTLGRLVPFRLAPGQFVELSAAGVGVGLRAERNGEDWQNARVGSWVEAKAGDEVTLTPGAVPLSDWNEEPPPAGQPGWWQEFIAARLRRAQPLPADADERRLLLYRAAMDLFGTPVNDEAFVTDRGPDALDSLAKRLARRAGVTPYTGPLQPGAIKFRVLPPDPDAAKRPRTADNPGRYTLGANAVLAITRRPVGERVVNEATIQFFSPDPKAEPPGKPVAVRLPDGYDTWAAAWERGGTVLWVREKVQKDPKGGVRGSIRSYDFSDPARVKEATLETPADLEKVPKTILEALR